MVYSHIVIVQFVCAAFFGAAILSDLIRGHANRSALTFVKAKAAVARL